MKSFYSAYGRRPAVSWIQKEFQEGNATAPSLVSMCHRAQWGDHPDHPTSHSLSQSHTLTASHTPTSLLTFTSLQDATFYRACTARRVPADTCAPVICRSSFRSSVHQLSRIPKAS